MDTVFWGSLSKGKEAVDDKANPQKMLEVPMIVTPVGRKVLSGGGAGGESE